LTLEGLYDCARLSRELHISRKVAEALMRRCPKQQVPGARKVYVRADHVQQVLDVNLVDVKTDAPLRIVA